MTRFFALSAAIGEIVALGVLIGGVPDNESGFHTQGCADTNWPVLRRGVYVAKNIYIYGILYV